MSDKTENKTSKTESKTGNKTGNKTENKIENKTGNKTENKIDNKIENKTGNKIENGTNTGSDHGIEARAMFSLTYGLFVLSAKVDEKENGCIINTVMQITDQKKRLAIAVNRANYTHDMICESGIFNLSVLSTSAPFSVFQQFGYQSGRTVDKLAGMDTAHTENGIFYLNHHTNAVLSARIVDQYIYDTHTLFVAEVTEAKTLSAEPSMTYQYYFDHVKPGKKPEDKKKGYICNVCGYIYEGDVLPEDFICPICKHGAEAFSKIED